MFSMKKRMPMQPAYLTQTQNKAAFQTRMQPGQPPMWMQPQPAPHMQGYYQQPVHGPQMANWQGMMGAYNGNSQPSYQLFENPLQQQEELYGNNPYVQQPGMFNPYPQQTFIPKQAKGFQTVMNSFKNQEGTLDVNKMLDTAGQMMNAVTQVSSMVKGLGGFFKV